MIQSKQIAFAKEVDDVMVLFVQVVQNRKKKEEISQLMDELMNALAGIDQVDDELQQNRQVVLQTVGYRTGELVDALLSPSVVPAVQPS